MNRKLYRSRKHRVIGGVCGGLAEYLNTDPVAIRLVWLLLVLVGGTGVLLYLLAWIIMPDEKSVRPGAPVAPAEPVQSVPSPRGATPAAQRDEVAAEPEPQDIARRTRIGGAILIAVGAYFLIDRLVYFDLSAWWPVLLILGGVALLLSSRNCAVEEAPPPATGTRQGNAAPPPEASREEIATPEAEEVEGDASKEEEETRED